MDKMNEDVCLYAPIRHKRKTARKTVRWDPGTSFDTRGVAISHRKRAQIKAGEDCRAGQSTKLPFITLRRTKAQNLLQFVFPAEPLDFDHFGDFDSSPVPLLPTLENAQEAINSAVRNAGQEAGQEAVQEAGQEALNAIELSATQNAPQNTMQSPAQENP